MAWTVDIGAAALNVASRLVMLLALMFLTRRYTIAAFIECRRELAKLRAEVGLIRDAVRDNQT